MFIPHTDVEREQMLASIGKKNIESLFDDIPSNHRFPQLDLPDALSEKEALAELEYLSEANSTTKDFISFLGGGAYNHYIPAAVDMLLRRGDFFTAYTPYQPEISQGTLQAIFEFQSLISNLTGMEISNASHYDGATAAAEACLSAYHNFRGKRNKFILSGSLNSQYREAIYTYLGSTQDVEIITSPVDLDESDEKWLRENLDENTGLVFVQYPDYFGRMFDYSALAENAHAKGALVAFSTYPIALGISKPPSEFGADFVVGEGQSLGIPLSFGGPYLGFFTTKNEFVRKVSGRLVGETVDKKGERGYVLTLTAREQHIRREKATSNICTNQGLLALAATIYMSLLGKHGLRQVSMLCFQKAHFAAHEINKIDGFTVREKTPFFNEFVVKLPVNFEVLNDYLIENGVFGGINLAENFPALDRHMLVSVTEMNSKEDIEYFCTLLSEVANE